MKRNSASVTVRERESGRVAQSTLPQGEGIRVVKSVTIARDPAELYQYWRHLENLPRIMSYLKSVKVVDDERSHWVAQGPAGSQVEWDAEIVNDVENQELAWRSVEGSQVSNAGTVYFTPAPGERGTEVKVEMRYDPPAGKLGVAVAKLFGQDPDIQVREDLRYFKQLMEAGEIATTQGQPTGDTGVLSKFTGGRDWGAETHK